MVNPLPIYAVTQFSGATGAIWNSLTTPVPDGVLTIESDTGIVKRGDGVTTYNNLAVFFNANYLQDVALTAQQTQAAATAAAASAQIASLHAQQAQLGNAVSAATIDATPTALAGMGVIPDGIAVQRIVGQLTAQNTVSGDIASWDISAIAIRRGIGLNPLMPILPEITSYYADTSMQACQITVIVNNLGISIVVTGITNISINWVGNIIFSGTSVL